MHLLLSLLLFWVNPWTINGQVKSTVDAKIRQSSKNVPTDLLLTRALQETSDTTLIFRYGQTVLERAQKNPKDYFTQMAAHRILADAYFRAGKLPQALYHITKAKEFARLARDKQWTISTLITLSSIEYASGMVEKAFTSSHEAIKIAKTDTNRFTYKEIYGQHANILYNLQNMAESRKYTFLALDAAQSIRKDTQAFVDYYNNIALSYRVEKNYPKALAYFQLALKYANHPHGRNDIIGVIEGNIGYTYYLLGKHTLAINKIKIDLATSEKCNNILSYLNSAYLIAEIYFVMGNRPAALHWYQKAEQKLYQFTDPSLEENLWLLKSRSNVAEMLGFHSHCLALRKKATQIQDNIIHNQADFKISNLMATYDLENKTQELNREQQLIQAKEKALAAAQKQRLYLVISLCVILALGGYSLWVLQQRSQIAGQLLTQKNTILTQNQIADQARILLEKAVNQRTAILGIVSHDLKAPVSRVQGLLELTKLDPDNEGQYSQMIEVSISDANNLIKNLLDDAALEEGKHTLKTMRFDLIQLVKELHTGLSYAARFKEIEMHIKTDLSRFFIISDRALLTRILENLISNALKFSPKNTVVTISIRPLVDYQVEIAIQDQGPGIPKEEQPKLFQSFYKGSAIPTGGESSTGLGLSIVHRLTQLLQGQIKVYSDRGIGAKFAITLPIHLGVLAADIDEEVAAHYRLLTQQNKA